MDIVMLKSKIHRAVVTEAKLDYVGSITIDEDLLDESNILVYEKVQIVDVENGERFETYTIPGKRGSGIICLNGPAARKVLVGDKVIIMSYANMNIKEAKEFKPTVIFVDDENKMTRKTNYESHGRIEEM